MLSLSLKDHINAIPPGNTGLALALYTIYYLRIVNISKMHRLHEKEWSKGVLIIIVDGKFFLETKLCLTQNFFSSFFFL